MLAQGVCVGIGSGMVYVPSLAMVSISFVEHRALALATVTSGAAIGEWSLVLSYIYIYIYALAESWWTSTGGVVYPIALQRLLPLVGFGWWYSHSGLHGAFHFPC